eukprot:1685357-Pleurochrysis_carterae.AAC.1
MRQDTRKHASQAVRAPVGTAADGEHARQTRRHTGLTCTRGHGRARARARVSRPSAQHARGDAPARLHAHNMRTTAHD